MSDHRIFITFNLLLLHYCPILLAVVLTVCILEEIYRELKTNED